MYKYIKDMNSELSQLEYYQSITGDEKYELLNEIIDISKHIVFFGGAGVSTESGIPDFRSKDGLYNQKDIRFEKYQPEYLLSRSCLYNNPKVFFEFYRQKMNIEGVKPNQVHLKLAEMESKGKLDGIITQNIDGLHQKAGSLNVQEIHGTTTENYCVKCNKKYPSDYIFKNTDSIPRCACCNNMIRPNVTLYEETLPKEAWKNAELLLQNADCFIVGGTSLTVYPASTLLDLYHGKYLIIINMEETNYDKWADVVFHEKLGNVFSKIKL